MTAPALEVDSVTVHYGPVLALLDATLSIQPGRVCGLVGMNGSGKSTLFKAIMGLLRPDAGTVRIHGSAPAQARKAGVVGYMPQSEAIDWTFPLSVRDVVLTGRYGHMGPGRRARTTDHNAAADALERVELTGYQQRQIGQLSGGQRKRAFLARCIAQGADVLLLDEPFAGVDKRSEATISRLLRDLADNGATILISTHDLHALPNLADEAILLMRTVLMHDHPGAVLQPHNLARAFGLDILNEDILDETRELQ
ncbi:metal ABC transporter ATP-binding protein [Mycolicibacterium sp. YH-1]|uniref:metal ABC transporter ATP-binding protein n=1 Tax=Mycolicibacterium sp. YH-1 TaxID=2908837 RepID=UPI001F4BFF47|nr:metal ABC transporter ATP-binding protein [Mycolicibacterium sp. YH-1]UNB52417.1 metal ABC transporter ATP-binding protein [Mycolicibacterium sp. YH-1]